MKNKLLQHMNWPIIESIIYSEEDNPHTVLGKSSCLAGTIFQTFQPQAVNVYVTYPDIDEKIEMLRLEEEGYFAVLVKEKNIREYFFIIENEDGTTSSIVSPYDFEPVIKENEIKKIEDEDCFNAHEILGAKEEIINGIKGVLFTVWSPNVLRISVVGDFNNWDGRRHQMRRVSGSSVFELFIPGLSSKEKYKFEIKLKNSLTYLKNDPYALSISDELEPVSIISDSKDRYDWKDKEWIEIRVKNKHSFSAMNILEVNLDLILNKKNSIKDVSDRIIEYVCKMNYTHIQCNIPMSHQNMNDEKIIDAFYALKPAYGTDAEFKYFIEQCHMANIGVIFDWNISGFSKALYSLMGFDGTALYEHENDLQGENYRHDMKVFNYARNEVSNFLISNALYWIDNFHIDGLCFKHVGEMLYLDYGKSFGEWISNIYGGNENLEAIDFLKKLNSIIKKRNKGILLIADDNTKFSNITEAVKDGGLGFDYKWNVNWSTDMLGFFAKDPVFRKNVYNEFTFSMLYAYSEQFLLPLSVQEMMHAKSTFLNRMYGNKNEKLANLRAMYTYMFLHPGKKLSFLEFDPIDNESWIILENQYQITKEERSNISNFVQDLHQLYKNENALWLYDYNTKGFKWINVVAVDDCMYTFTRKGKTEEDTLFIVCNFSNKSFIKKTIGVPCIGKFKEIFNSDLESYGGNTAKIARKKTTKEKKKDGMKCSMNIDLAPLSIAVYKYEKIKKKK